MNANENLVESLANSEIYQDYEEAFSEATGMPLALRPVVTWKLNLHGKKKESPFCALMGLKSRTCAGCLQLQDTLCKSATDKPVTMACSFGLCEAAVPVKLGDETIGYLQTGQVMHQKPTEKQFEAAAKLLAEQGVVGNPTEIRNAYFNTPVVSTKRLNSMTHLLSVFADHLSLMGNQISMQKSNAENPSITKARQYIEEHYMEDLSLGQVAGVVHTSTFYFCKLFKRSTGINFTEYVSRVRVEKAKQLLLNPNLRVSEIAYEVGFQSLTHFNRVFKKLIGESPTEYRVRLPKMG